MGPHIIYGPRSLSAAAQVLSIQETRLALLPIRPLLLRHHPQLRLLLDLPQQHSSIHRVLLPFTWVSSQCGDYMEE
jgi:hypothetical protein